MVQLIRLLLGLDIMEGVVELSTIITVIVKDHRIRLKESDKPYLKRFSKRDYIGFDTLS